MTTATPTHNESLNSFIVKPKYLIPVEPLDTVLVDHCVVISDGKIAQICVWEDLDTQFSSFELHDLPNHALIPGFINAHGHSAMSLFRGIANDLPLMDWLNNHIWPAEGKWVNEEFVRDGTRLAIAEMIKSGTTTFSDMYFYPNISAEEADKAGIRAQLTCPILDFPTVWASGPEEYLQKALDLNESYQGHPSIQIGLGPHAPYTVSDEPLVNAKNAALQHAIPLQIHLHETQFEVDDATQNTGERPISRLDKLGLFDNELSLQCVHMTTLNEEDIKIIEDSNASVIHCPESNLKLASGFCEVQRLLDRGINVALGTDGAASNNDLDMMGEMRTAALIAKPVANDASALSAPNALKMATLSGAKALGIEQITGSIELGKSADLVAIDLSKLNSQPSFDPIADIVYSASAHQISHVWVDGSIKLRDGELVEINEEEIISTAKEWRSKITE